MDLQSALICVLIFVLSGALLLLISMFGMREKSYEEALAEQRQLAGGLLGSGHRPKSKEKKQKKAGKKVKEKPVTNPAVVDNEPAEEQEAVEDVVDNSPAPAPAAVATAKPHVEFEEPIVVEPPVNININNKKRGKKEKMKPILLNKEKSPVSDVEQSKAMPANHFEKIHPKDDFELLQSHKDELVVKQEKIESEVKTNKGGKAKHHEKENVEPQQQPKSTKAANKEKKNQQQPAAVQNGEAAVIVEQVAVVKQQAVHTTQPPPTAGNTVKDKKKKKSEFNTLQQLTANDKHGVNVSLLVPLVRKADLSRSEIQILIDLLLNKQHEAPAVLDEWSEGRADPVQKLKRQLADKERALSEEQEALASAQNKLREVRAELNAERSRLLQSCRGLEETVHAKHTELQAAAARLHAQNQKMQQLQMQGKEETMTVLKLRDELNAMQLQRQQLEMHLNQKQEADASIQSQLTQLRNELQEQQNLNAQINMELRTVREKSHAEKEMLHERVRQIESQAVHYKNESEQRQELMRQLEESRRACVELEHRCTVAHHAEAELTMRCQQQLEETRRMEASQAKAHDDVAKVQAEVNRLNHQLKQQQEEKEQIIADLQSQLVSLRTEKTNASKEDKNKESELTKELASVRGELRVQDQLTAEMENVKQELRDIQSELLAQRNKNDELRKKNWKVMEALNVAETSLRSKQNSSVAVNDDSENLKKAKAEEQRKYKKFLQRLFPEVSLSEGDNWMTDAEREIKKQLSSAADSETDVSKLVAQVARYRTIIDDTEGMLNRLQSHVEREETNWRQQLRAKDAEIESLKEQQQGSTKCARPGHGSPDEHGVRFAFSCIERSLPLITEQLQAQITVLQERLAVEQQARREREEECESLQSRLAPSLATHAKHTQIDNGGLSLAGAEQIAEEKLHLAEELRREQNKCQELTEEVLRLRSSHADSISCKLVQNHTANGTTLENAELTNSNSASSSVSPTASKSRNKNKKKKAAVSN